MAAETGAAESARKPDNDTRAGPAPQPAGPGATPTAPSGTSLGERQIRAKPDGPVIGKADDPAERQADAAADQVMRMPDPAVAAEPAAAAPTVAPAVRRASDAAAENAPPASAELQDYLEASRGQGFPLPEETRAGFEEKYQRPFGDVRIHDDDAADAAARSIGALAFTHGTDIYFRSGTYDPQSDAGKRLLAHELAHVVQQRPGINRAPVRRAPDAKPKKGKGPAGTIVDTGKTKVITIDKIGVPKFKQTMFGSAPIKLRKGTRADNPTKQRPKWLAGAKTPVTNALSKRLGELRAADPALGAGPEYFLKVGNTGEHLIGTEASIASAIRLPFWNRKGEKQTFEIDHQHEAQLGGPDEIGNLWLLEGKRNGESGRLILQNINQTLSAFLDLTAPGLIPKVPPEAEVRDTNSAWQVVFGAAVGEAPDADDSEWWKLSELETDDAFLKPITFASDAERTKLQGSSTKLVIFDRAVGGDHDEVPRTGDESPLKGPAWTGPLFEFKTVRFAEADKGKGTGRLLGTAFPKETSNSPLKKAPLDLPIKKIAGVEWGGVVTPGAIDYWVAKPFSPVSFPEPEFDIKKGIVGRGVIAKPTIKLLENVEFAVVLDGDLRIEATIQGGSLSLPGPFKVRGGSLTVSAGLNGLGIDGRVDFEIEKLATGFIAGSAKSGSGFALTGELNFDTKMFTEAKLKVHYRDGKWGVEGELGVGPGHIKGIKRASAKVTVNDGTVTAEGEFESSLKGVDKGKVGFRYNETTGMEITGEILLGKGIPGIKSGKLDATVKQVADGWSLAAGVVLEPSVPGLTGAISGRYDDGAFQVDADLAYERGLAKGVLKLGLTNQTVGPDGRPAGAPKADGSLTAYGGGSVTLAITPWLQGTVGLLLKPNGEIEVTGKVEMPPVVNVFDEQRVERTLLSIGFDIPIVGVAVAGQRIGIFATIRGGLSASAGFGPGQLRDLSLAVVYNPDRPDDTTVTGAGTFVVPANAGLRLQVDGGLGAGIPVVSATAGVSIFGEVGVTGAATAAAAVNWTPRTGIVLDARGELSVEPKFRFGIEAFVDVSADLWLTTIELYHQKWTLASFEYGSNLRFGLIFPLHYESGKPFSLSFDQIQWTYPRIDPGELLGGLMKQLVG